MEHKYLTGLSLATMFAAFVFLVSGGTAVGETKADSKLTSSESIASSQCEDGDLSCLAGLTAGFDDGSSGDSRSRNGSANDQNPEEDDSRSHDDSKSGDKDSRDDTSKSDDDSKSVDEGSRDDGGHSDDDSRSGDDGSKDDDSRSDEDSQSDDESSKDDDSHSDEDSQSDDESSKDDDSHSDDDSSSDDVEPLQPNLSISDGQGEEFNEITQVPVSLRVFLDAPTSSTVTVDWATEDGSGLAGMDYLPASGRLDFAPNMTEAAITVFIIGDDVGEPEESFFVRLSLPSGAMLLDDLGEIVILDDDDIDD